MVSELEETNGVKTRGNKKSVLECIAKYNLKGQCPTQKEILSDLKKITDESLKKIIQRIRKMGLVITHPEKIGNEYQYVLSNRQDIIKVNKVTKKNGTVNENEDLLLENSIEKFFLQVLKNKVNPEFHNITLASQLSDNGDYHQIHNWLMPSQEKNKAKTFEKRISRHRLFKIVIYPNGKTIINIAASRQPFEWHFREGWTDFIVLCGEINNEIKNALSHNEPLKSRIYDWQVLQVDVGYDIPLSNLDKKNGSSSKGSFTFSRLFNECLNVKHLDRVYQIYNKQLRIKEVAYVLRNNTPFLPLPLPLPLLQLNHSKKRRFQKKHDDSP